MGEGPSKTTEGEKEQPRQGSRSPYHSSCFTGLDDVVLGSHELSRLSTSVATGRRYYDLDRDSGKPLFLRDRKTQTIIRGALQNCSNDREEQPKGAKPDVDIPNRRRVIKYFE